MISRDANMASHKRLPVRSTEYHASLYHLHAVPTLGKSTQQSTTDYTPYLLGIFSQSTVRHRHRHPRHYNQWYPIVQTEEKREKKKKEKGSSWCSTS